MRGGGIYKASAEAPAAAVTTVIAGIDTCVKGPYLKKLAWLSLGSALGFRRERLPNKSRLCGRWKLAGAFSSAMDCVRV